MVQQTGLWATNYLNNMPLFVLPLLVIGGASLVIWSNARSKDKLSFVASGICAAAIVFSLASAMFPFLFPSSFDMAASLTIWDASSSHLTLMLMLGVTLVVFPMVLAYTAFVFRVLRGKVTVEDIEKDSKTLY